MLKAVTVRVALIAFAATLSLSAHALADAPKKVDVPAGDLTAALETLAKQSGVEFVYSAEQLKGIHTNGVHGEFTPEKAVIKLLEGTKLKLTTHGSGALLISENNGPGTSPPLEGTAGSEVRASSQTGDGSGEESNKKSFWDRFRVAQVDKGQTSSPSTVEKQDEQASKRKPVVLEEVVVTGSRIPQTGTEKEGSQFVRSYTREDISKTGRTTVAEFINTLPDVSIAASGSVNQTYLGQTTVRLHGLPSGTTLVLLNGQRVNSDYLGFFDLSNIPLSAVERVEVLPVGASAIYGSDALGGAVNFILRRNFSGFESNAQYGAASGTDEFNYDLAWGNAWERGSISIVGNYQTRTELLGRERGATSTTQNPSGAQSLFATDTCDPGSVYSLNGQPLPGLTSTSAGIPRGISGTPMIQQFQASAGAPNFCNSDLDTAFIPRVQREGALASGHYQFMKSLDLFTEIIYSRERQNNRTGDAILLFDGSLGAFTIGPANPYNPFGEAVGISFGYPGFGVHNDNEQSFFRPLVGIRGALFGDWSYELIGFLSRDLSNADLTYAYGAAAAIQAALDSSNPATALNPFTTSAPGTPALLQSLISAVARAHDRVFNQTFGQQALVRGALINLPSGPLRAVLGVEREAVREEALTQGQGPQLTLRRDAYAAFTEERIPLWADHKDSNAGDKLALTLAARYDHSDDFGGKATWQSGIEFRPTEALLLRGGYATSYEAPTLPQLSGGISTFAYSSLIDPERGNTVITVPVVNFGSNAGLVPETGNSRTLGLVYSSRELPGLKTSLTWYAINISNYIAISGVQALIDNSNLFPGAITRGPLSAADMALGYTGGPITNINDLYYNFGTLDVSGVDLDLSYTARTSFGELTPSLAVTNTYKWMSAIKPGTSAVSYLGQANLFGTGFAPRWKGNVGLGWQQGLFVATVAGRYIGRYNDYQDFGPNSHTLGDTWSFDANLRIALAGAFAPGSRWLTGSYLEIGSVNLFNKLPQLSYGNSGYDPNEADIRGRFLYARLGIKL